METPIKKKTRRFLVRAVKLTIFLTVFIAVFLLFINEELILFYWIEGKGQVLPDELLPLFYRNEPARLLARPLPDTGQGFREWKGTITTTLPEAVVYLNNRSRMITAVFSDEPAPGTSFQYVTIQCAGPGCGTTDPPPGDWVFRTDVEETFLALPAEGHFFGGWQIFFEDGEDEDQTTSTTELLPPYTLPPGKNLTAVAWFHKKGGIITLEKEGNGWFNLPEGSHVLAAGTEMLVSAGAADGWYLDGIRDEKDELVSLSTSHRAGTFSIRVTEDKRYRAIFKPLEKHIRLTIDAADPVSGQILFNDSPCTSTLQADYGTTLNLQAEPLNSASAFAGWSGESLQEPTCDPSLSFTVEDDTELTAHFVPAISFLDLEAVIDGEAATLPPESLSLAPGRHGFTGTALSRALLEAPLLTDRDMAFSHWEGDLPGDINPADRQLVLSMEADRKIRACFTRLNLCTLTVEKSEGARGKLVPPPGSYAMAPGSEIILQALPELGRSFGGWRIHNTEGLKQTAITPQHPLKIEENLHVTAFFAQTNCHIALVSSHPEGKITPSPGDYLLAPGTMIDLRAETPKGLAFHHWLSAEKGILSTEAFFRTTLTEDDSFQAVFGRPLHRLDLSIEGRGKVESNQEQFDRVEEGSVIELQARPDPDSVFLEWEGDLPANAQPSQPKISLTMDKDSRIMARFIPAEVQLHLQLQGPEDMENPKLMPDPGTHGYLKGTGISLLAMPPVNSDFVFTGWTGDLNSIHPDHMLTPDEDITLTACFARKEETDCVRLTLLPTDATTSSHIRNMEAGSYLFSRNALIHLTAVLADNAFFGGWTGQIEKDIVYKDKALLLDEDKTVGMRTAQAGSVLTLLLDSVEVGRIDPPPGTYRLAEHMKVTLKAYQSDSQYSFAGWHTHAGLLLSRRGTYHFTIEPGIGRHEIVGIFKKYVVPEPLTLCLNRPGS
jgi:uncharacterized repeat protein (TIGR02543 family)